MRGSLCWLIVRVDCHCCSWRLGSTGCLFGGAHVPLVAAVQEAPGVRGTAEEYTHKEKVVVCLWCEHIVCTQAVLTWKPTV